MTVDNETGGVTTVKRRQSVYAWPRGQGMGLPCDCPFTFRKRIVRLWRANLPTDPQDARSSFVYVFIIL